MKRGVGKGELLIAAATGAIFGVVGYWTTRYVHAIASGGWR